MNTTVRKRIEQINRGEVPQGYKRTKIGIIPEDWEVSNLSKLVKTCGGGTPKTSESRYWQGDVPWISSADLSEEKLYSAKVSRFINPCAIQNSATKLCPKGSIAVVSRVGVGKLAYLNFDFCTSQDFINVIETNLDKIFILYSLKNRLEVIISKTQGTSIKGITTGEFNNLELAYPQSQTEQQKIAEILQTQDRAIELQEQLLEQKQLQKKYLVQQLLTGKIRLKGFTSEWEKTKLDDILKERNEYCIKNGKYKHVTLSTDGIYAKTDRYDRDFLVASDEKKYKVTHYGDICYNPANLKFGVICLNKFGDAIFSPIYVTFEINKNVNFDFLDLYVKQKNFINSVRKYEEGSIYERMAVKPRDMLVFEIKLPSKEEQDAIAKILITADREIELIQEKLREERLKKKALMQLLLTGIVRV